MSAIVHWPITVKGFRPAHEVNYSLLLPLSDETITIYYSECVAKGLEAAFQAILKKKKKRIKPNIRD